MSSIEDAYKENWEPWITLLTAPMKISDGEGGTATTPFSAYGETFETAQTSMLVHLGIVLREHGFHPAWLKED